MASFMRLSSLKAAHVDVGRCLLAGNPGTLRSEVVTFFDCFTVNEGWVPHCPDFLLRLVALIRSMRLSLMKGALADLSSTAWQEIRVKPGFRLSGMPQHSTRLFLSSRPGADLRCASPSSNSAAFKPSPFAVAFRKGALQVPRLPPDFLSGLVASVNLMRLSSKKAAYVVVLEICVVGNPEFAPNEQPGLATQSEVSVMRWLCDKSRLLTSLAPWTGAPCSRTFAYMG